MTSFHVRMTLFNINWALFWVQVLQRLKLIQIPLNVLYKSDLLIEYHTQGQVTQFELFRPVRESVRESVQDMVGQSIIPGGIQLIDPSYMT